MPAETTLTLPVLSTLIPEAAELYALAGMAPIPLYGLTSSGDCSCGNECPPRNRGKHPIGSDWQRKATLERGRRARSSFRGHRPVTSASISRWRDSSSSTADGTDGPRHGGKLEPARYVHPAVRQR